MNRAGKVAQISNLLYRRFPIGRATNLLVAIIVRTLRRLEALLSSRLEISATRYLGPAQECRADRVSDFGLLSGFGFLPSDFRCMGRGNRTRLSNPALEMQKRVRIVFPVFFLVFSLVFVCAHHVRAQNPLSDFEAANKLYYEASFTNAAAAYEKMIQSGRHAPALYFNLGNAWFKSGQIGRAIAAYRHAEQLTPRDPDVRANLQFARNQAQGPSFSPNRRQLWLMKLTLNEWTLLAIGSLWLWFFLLAALQWRPQWKNSFRSLLFGLTAASLVFCGCLAAALYEDRGLRTAVVIAREAVVRHGPLEESQNSFTVHDGAELRVLDRKDDWLLVTTDPRRIGWLRRDQVLLAAR